MVTVTSGPGQSGNPYQGVQRTQIDGASGIRVKGTIGSSSVTSIQVRVRNVSDDSTVLDWTSPKHQIINSDNFEIVLDDVVPTGGWYKWSFRTYSYDRLIATDNQSVAWGVGVVGLLLGQSNQQEMWSTYSAISPATSNDKVAVWLNAKPDGSTLDVNTWANADTHTIGNGVYKLGDVIQSGLADDASHGDIPVFLVGVAIGATSLLEWADWASAGCWLTDIGGSGLDAYLQSTLYAATGSYNAEFVMWHQGEAEATARFVNGRSPEPQEYRSALTKLYDYLSDRIPTWRSSLAFIASGPGRLFTYDSAVTLSTSSLYAETQVVNDDILDFTQAGDHGYYTTHGVDGVTTGAYYGLHYTAAGYETVATRAGSAVLASICVSPAGSTVSKRGPRISYGIMGDDTASDDDKYLRTKFTLWVEHDEGTDLTLGTDDSIPAFEVYDYWGPLAITAISKGSTASGMQPLVFTLERDTSETDSAADDFDYSAEDHVRGNRVIVKYLGNGSIEDDYMIVDDEGAPLRPSWGANGQDSWKWDHCPVAQVADTPPVYRIAAEITAVASPADTLTVEAPTGWAVSGITENKMFRPGDRFVVMTAAGLYVATGTVRKVSDYTDTSSTVDVDLSHAISGASAGDFLIVNPGLSRAGGIVVMSRTPDHFGEVYSG